MARASGEHWPGMTTSFQVIVEPEDGVYVTYVPALDFASTFGPTSEAALERTRELIAGYLEAAQKGRN